ncbi:putative nuclease HARBI1 [Saccostrea echinata]|uniref:putative nuclease HARBI1 n=1 Tax=Saccostrea echinata TaxID=191078 RepID=UPI002A805256|nr:putative nuclease HARBI1 [Saccostrea echinata]
MAAAFVVLFDSERAKRRERVFRDRSNPLDTFNDTEVVARYRFPRRYIFELVDLVQDKIQHPTTRSYAIPSHIQVLTTLRFLAKGEYLSEVGDLHGISISSASRIVTSVCSALCESLDNVKFPETNEDLAKVKEDFYQLASFPNVVGAIDGTLIPIQGMTGDEEPNLICRKGFSAINVQGVVDANLRFSNIVVRWPGATHDSFILQNSSLPNIMRRVNGWLLGDSGYPLRKWLLTPFVNPRSPQEQRYNNAHCTTRNTVERAFGVLKSRFRCIHKTGGSLQFAPEKCIKIIECCFRLHNKAIDARTPLIAGNEPVQLYQNNVAYQGLDNDGIAVRQRVVQRF